VFPGKLIQHLGRPQLALDVVLGRVSLEDAQALAQTASQPRFASQGTARQRGGRVSAVAQRERLMRRRSVIRIHKINS